MASSVLVVMREHVELWRALAREFADSPAVTVLLDRRTGERRRQDRPVGEERRQSERRNLVRLEADARVRPYLLTRPHPRRTE